VIAGGCYFIRTASFGTQGTQNVGPGIVDITCLSASCPPSGLALEGYDPCPGCPPSSSSEAAGTTGYPTKNRYLSIVAPVETVPGLTSAIKITFSRMPGPDPRDAGNNLIPCANDSNCPTGSVCQASICRNCPFLPDYSAFQGRIMYVGDEVISGGSPTGVYKLSPTPVFRDWGALPRRCVGGSGDGKICESPAEIATCLASSGGGCPPVAIVNVSDCNIVPCAVYEAQRITNNCSIADENFSSPITIRTTDNWGNGVGSLDLIANKYKGALYANVGQPDFGDVQAAIEAFQGLPKAPPKTWIDVNANNPFQGVSISVDFADVGKIVSAFGGQVYNATPIIGPAAPSPCAP
jgi:hypothetical protein